MCRSADEKRSVSFSMTSGKPVGSLLMFYVLSKGAFCMAANN